MTDTNKFDISLKMYIEFGKQYWLNSNNTRYGQAFYDYFSLYKSLDIAKEFDRLNIYNETDITKTINKIHQLFNFV